ncbi:MAG TPA: AAA family ATPase [Thermomicrobiales bacterium]|nr:AAA family ATPase [Thermomicrobiales bacterium]
MAPAGQQRIFISYARGDSDFARELREWLVRQGHQPWMDLFDIPAGARWPTEIDRALKASEVVIGLLSPGAVRSTNVLNEWDWAIANGRRLILMLVEPCDVPFHYVSLNYIDVTVDRDAAFDVLREALAQPMASTPGAAEDGADAEDQRPAPSHGMREPVSAQAGSRLRRALSRQRSAPRLAGREPEQQRLQAALSDTVTGQGGLILLGGEAGIGKTTLTRWLQAQAVEQGALSLLGGCYDLTTTPPYGPWVEILRAYEPRDGLPPVPEHIRDEAKLAAIPSQAALFEIVGEFFAEISEQRPLLLVLEDLHWADQSTLDLLRFFARFLSGLSILVIATYRDDELTRRHPLFDLLPRLAREPGTTRMLLRRLYLDGTRALVEERYALANDDGNRLVEYLQRMSEGNPFFASEVLNTLQEESVLRRKDDGWRLGELSELSVPPLLRQVIEDRLQRLEQSDRSLLEVAAAIGHDVPIDLWQQVSGGEASALNAVMSAAFDANLLEESDADTLKFRHALIREALYAGIGPLQRRDWHRRVADTLIGEARPDPDSVVTHLEHAHDPRALEWLARAGDRAMSRFAWDVAIQRYERSLELLERQGQPDPVLHCEVLLALGEAQNQGAAGRVTTGTSIMLGAGASLAGRDTFWRAAAIARSSELPEHLGRAALGVVGFNPHAQQGGLEGITLLEEALRLLSERDSDLRVRLLTRLGTDTYMLACYGGLIPLTDELTEQILQRSDASIVMARRLRDPAALGYALTMRGMQILLHSSDELQAIADEMLSIARRTNDPTLLCWALIAIQRQQFGCGNTRASQDARDALGEAARRLQLPFLTWAHATAESGAALRAGRFLDAERWLDEADRIQPLSGAATYGRITLCRELGRIDEAVTLAERITNMSSLLIHFSSGLYVLCLLDAGQTQSAQAAFHQVTVDDLLDPRLQLRSLSWYAEASAELGMAAWTEALYDHMLPSAGWNHNSNSTDYTGGSVSYHLGLLATVMERWDAAERHFEDALRMNREWGVRPYVAYTQYGWADMLHRRDGPGDRERALALLDEALALARDIGMVRLERLATGLLDRLKSQV